MYINACCTTDPIENNHLAVYGAPSMLAPNGYLQAWLLVGCGTSFGVMPYNFKEIAPLLILLAVWMNLVGIALNGVFSDLWKDCPVICFVFVFTLLATVRRQLSRFRQKMVDADGECLTKCKLAFVPAGVPRHQSGSARIFLTSTRARQ